MKVDIALHDAVLRRLRVQNVTLISIAREAGYSPGFVTMVSQGHRSSRIVEALIASKLDEKPEKIWPSRYQASQDGEKP